MKNNSETSIPNNEEQNSFRQIFKATSLFGGVQVFTIIISIIRTKFVAILLGPAGMGISGLLASTRDIIIALTNFGLKNSAVKSVAEASATGDNVRVSQVVTVLRRLVWITGLIGTILTAILSPVLSEITFGNRNYTFAFIWVSITLLFDQLSAGQLVVLQGLRKLKYLARANVIGLIIGLLISVPVYYFWRLDGIVPVIILTSLTSMLLSWFFANKIKINSSKISRIETITVGKEMMKLGVAMSLNGIFLYLTSYLLRIFISNTGGIEQVGLYNSGFSIINVYVGMIFAAMSTDYYPRLAGVSNDNNKSRNLMNQQAEIAVLILAPFILCFMVYIDLIILLLYSAKFISISDMVLWAVIGIFFKAASWSVAYIFLAKGAAKIFLLSELVANFYTLTFNVIGYKIAGLEGLGISFLVAYVVYLIQVYLIAHAKYEFSFNGEFYKIAGFQITMCLLGFIVSKFLNSSWIYIVGSVLIIISALYSFRELEKRIGLKEIVLNYFHDLRNK